mgnify:CR=1 FL=1
MHALMVLCTDTEEAEQQHAEADEQHAERADHGEAERREEREDEHDAVEGELQLRLQCRDSPQRRDP